MNYSRARPLGFTLSNETKLIRSTNGQRQGSRWICFWRPRQNFTGKKRWRGGWRCLLALAQAGAAIQPFQAVVIVFHRQVLHDVVAHPGVRPVGVIDVFANNPGAQLDPGSADQALFVIGGEGTVDFAAVAQAAGDTGAMIYGPVAQGEFLRSLGIETRAATLAAGATEEQAADIETALKRLTDAGAMGELFKVMALTAPGQSPPPGFS